MKNGKCVCKEDYVSLNGVCTKCPANSWVSENGKECECKKDFYWNKVKNTCDFLVCGRNSEVKFVKNKFACICFEGYRDHYGNCEEIIECPPNSAWNQKKLTC